jgi:hypothetical protein
MRIFVVAWLGILLAACAPAARVEGVKGVEISCPDPAARSRLEAGATYRDLAKSRAAALEGWRVCHDALSIAQSD